MNMHRQLARHTFWLTASRFIAQGLAVVFTVLLARRLGSEGFGATLHRGCRPHRQC
jgi:O-antigen/teichoic acid export membrane protein